MELILRLMAVCKCLYGTVARVVYSRLFPDWTTDRTGPQTGRLNKSPHTVGAFANRHKDKSIQSSLVVPPFTYSAAAPLPHPSPRPRV